MIIHAIQPLHPLEPSAPSLSLQAAVASEEQVVKYFMHLSLIHRELPRMDPKTKEFAELYRRSVALTLNLANENCLQGATRALSQQLQQLQRAAQDANGA